MDRILGILEGSQPGPLVICVAAIHGNEQIGIHAFRNVFSAIQKHNIPLKGKLVGIAGNLQAIEANTRYLDYDLNRCWKQEIITSILEDTYREAAENEEVKAIYDLIEQESQGNYTLKVIADLHATSADKGNFVVVPDDEGEHKVIRALQLPVVLGLDEHLKGTLVSYYHHKHGYVSFAFEGGVIGSDGAYRLHTSGLWEILDKAGAITHHDHAVEDHYANDLYEVGKAFPRKVNIIHRHQISSEDSFRMLPGFHNFQPVHKGQLLATDKSGHIESPIDGMIFMPLYQNTGDDGFFIVWES